MDVHIPNSAFLGNIEAFLNHFNPEDSNLIALQLKWRCVFKDKKERDALNFLSEDSYKIRRDNINESDIKSTILSSCERVNSELNLRAKKILSKPYKIDLKNIDESVIEITQKLREED